MMLNSCEFIGRLGKDAEIRSMNDGKEVATLSLAVSEKWKDRQTGEKKEKTEWIRISVFNEGLVSVIKNYTKKGSQIYVRGKMKTRKWTDQSGVDRYSTEIVLSGFDGKIVLLDSKGEDSQQNHQNSDFAESARKSEQAQAQAQAPADDLDDSIPF